MEELQHVHGEELVGPSALGEMEGRVGGAFNMGRDGGKSWWGIQHGERLREEVMGPSEWGEMEGRVGGAFNMGRD